MLVALGGDSLQVKPSPHPKLQVLSPVEIERHAAYDGPTWLDQAILSKWRPDSSARGFVAEIDSALIARGRWVVGRQLAEAAPAGDILPKPDMMRRLRQAETERLAGDLSRRLNASYLPAEPGRHISGVYERSIATPTGKLAVLRQQDTFTLAPWRPVLEPFKGRAVMGMIGPNRVTWSLDRGRGLPGRGEESSRVESCDSSRVDLMHPAGTIDRPRRLRSASASLLGKATTFPRRWPFAS
jgi:hypothetical protein